MSKKAEKEEASGGMSAAIAVIRKKYGDGAIMSGDDIVDVESVSTGCFAIDDLISNGLPRGRVLEIFGEPSQGKSVICTFLAGQVQKAGGTVVYLDAECAFNKEFAERVGLDINTAHVSQPETLEETMDIIRALAEANAADLCIVDSVAALTPKSELERDEMLKDTMAVQARLLSTSLRILTGPISRSKMTVIFVNQTRTNLAVTWGNKETTSGGKALRFSSSVRIRVSTGDKIEDEKKNVIGRTLVLSCVKNKVGIPFKKAEIDLYYETGIDLVADALSYGTKTEVITLTGNTYSYGDVKLGVGKAKATEALKADPELLEKIKKDIYAKLK
jgi:recombination protein RecA